MICHLSHHLWGSQLRHLLVAEFEAFHLLSSGRLASNECGSTSQADDDRWFISVACFWLIYCSIPYLDFTAPWNVREPVEISDQTWSKSSSRQFFHMATAFRSDESMSADKLDSDNRIWRLDELEMVILQHFSILHFINLENRSYCWNMLESNISIAG